MCGICGIVDKNQKVTSERLRVMSDIIAHRGPDGSASWINPQEDVGLGHRRLSIIDLSHAGDQPMHYLDRYTIIFNGEIYNYLELKDQLQLNGYTFHSQSDTEVLLALYDKYKRDCLNRLDGMFAFVIYDRKENILFCARDRFGEKPFFYHYTPGRSFYFSSEMKALWTSGIQKSVNPKMLYNYLQTGALQNINDPSETFYQGINKLRSSHFLVLDCDQCEIIENAQYWELSGNVSVPANPEEAAEQLQHLFQTSVKRRLRSDVPVGSSLSGGLDSSLIVMLIDQMKKGTDQKQKTFSARFPGFAKDEGKYMDLVIGQCNVEPHFVFPDSNSMIDNIEKVFYHQEEPFGSASICAQYEVMKLTRANDVIVLLDGQGADEMLAGYHAYYSVYFNEIRKTDRQLYRKESEAYSNIYTNSVVNPLQRKDIKYYTKKYAAGPYQAMKQVKELMVSNVVPELNSDFYGLYKKSRFPSSPVFSSLNESLSYSMTKSGLELLLRYADRNSMAHSVEVRLPFLFHELVEYVFSLPSNFKIRDGWTKWIMRVTFDKLLPQEIAWRKDKIGYEPPQKNWMEDKKVKEIIFEKRQRLVSNGILHRRVLNLNGSGTSIGKETNNWSHWMAGNLFD